MKLITISGLDGSGKSTQIKLLKEYLESQRKRVFYFHAIEFGIAKKITGVFFEHSMSEKEKSVTHANWFQIILRKIFLMIDIFRFNNLRKKLEKEKFDYIVSVRYFYDSIVNIEYLLSYPKVQPLASQRLNLRIAIPDLAIYLRISPNIIMQRERKPDQGLDYLERKKKLYDSKISSWHMKIINGDRNQEEIFEEIKLFL